jgi:uncharacterized protein YjbJ (UPF0337 family)
MELFRLFGTVLIDDKEALAALKNVDEKGQKTKNSLQDIAKKGAAIGAAVIAGTGAAIGGMLALANSTSDTAGKWLELSQRTDIGVESLQRWGYAAVQSGADVEKLEVGMKKLSTNIVDATAQSGASRDAFGKLGLSMSDLSKMSPEQTFDAIMAKLADMPESAEKNVIGNQLLGKAYTELKPLLAEGSAGMEALKNKANELGIVMSEDSVKAAEGFGDQMDDVKMSFDGIKNKIVGDLLPSLSNMLTWFSDKMPAIQETAGNALGFISDTIGFIAENSNILIPVLGGLAAAFVIMQIIGVVNGLMAAYTAFTTTATGVQIGLNAALMANPVGLVVAAIAALIAIGIALYMNWDKIKEKAGEIFGKLQDVVGGAIEKIKGFFQKVIDFVKNNWQGLLLLIVNPFAGAFKLAYDNCEGFRNKVNEIFEKIKSAISDKINAIKTTVSSVFGLIKDIMANPFEAAKAAISIVIDKIKGFLNFKWEFPKLKMPHFSISGSMNPLKWIEEGLPKIGVDWYAKGGIFDKPTIFNTPYGLKGVGDASSPEVVAPLSDLNRMIEDGISRAIAPLYMNQPQAEAPIIENTIYFSDDKVWASAKRGKLKENRRYELQSVF